MVRGRIKRGRMSSGHAISCRHLRDFSIGNGNATRRWIEGFDRHLFMFFKAYGDGLQLDRWPSDPTADLPRNPSS